MEAEKQLWQGKRSMGRVIKEREETKEDRKLSPFWIFLFLGFKLVIKQNLPMQSGLENQQNFQNFRFLQFSKSIPINKYGNDSKS